MSDDNESMRDAPINDLDLQLMTINSKWGKEIAPELKDRLTAVTGKTKLNPDGSYKLDKSHLWGLLTYYTRDIRLGNLDKATYPVACAWLDFSGDCLRLGCIRTFLTTLSRVITMLELSQSRGGFLRKQLNTVTHQQYNEFSEKNNKKGLFGDVKSKGDRS